MPATRAAAGAVAVEDRLFRALAGLRVVVLLNAWGVGLYTLDQTARPAGVVACLALMTVWTGVATWGYASAARRTRTLLGLDLAVALAALLAGPWVKGPDLVATVPGFWIMAVLLAWAVRLRAGGGLVAGVVLAGVDLALRNDWTLTVYGNAFLLVLGGPVVGYLTGSLQQMAEERDRAERVAATAAERARLARAVHDGTLQVLALVQRRAGELGPHAADLGRLAGEQERGLRRLIQAQDAVAAGTSTAEGTPGPYGPDGAPVVAGDPVDVATLLASLGARTGVEVVLPGGAVPAPTVTAHELVAAVVACLDNVARHVGEDARAWVLLEDLGDEVAVSVRDEGPGIPAGRLDEAAAQGRLGVRESVCGRVSDLGGTATLDTGRHGTTWRLAVPREQP